LRIGETGAIWVNEKMETSAEGVYAAGDCAETTHLVTGKRVWIPLGSTANKQGRVVGANVCGGNSTFPGVIGTTVFQTFEFNIAKTGLSVREAEKEGFHPVQSIVRGFDRAHHVSLGQYDRAPLPVPIGYEPTNFSILHASIAVRLRIVCVP
jgi:NADPH-dependent 2,4-dienoyl-CoA reductase/sulfur reductase-like enzyme